MNSAERLKLRQQIHRDWLKGGWTTQHELAVRHGVSDSLVCKILKQIRLVAREEFEEQAAEDTVRRLSQLDDLVGKANNSFEISKRVHVETSVRREKKRCEKCDGTGCDEDGGRCRRCEGEGCRTEEVETRKTSGRAGDPRFLAVVLKGLQEIARIRGMHPGKTRQTVGSQYNVIVGGERGEAEARLLREAPAELLLKARRLMIELQEAAGGNGEVVDAEFGEPGKEKDEGSVA